MTLNVKVTPFVPMVDCEVAHVKNNASFHTNIIRMKLFQAYVSVHRQWKGG